MEPFIDFSNHLLSGGDASLLTMLFDVTVDIDAVRDSELEKQIVKTNASGFNVREIYVTITKKPRAAVFVCIGRLQDESRPFTMSTIRIKFDKRARTMTRCTRSACSSLLRIASVMLYGDKLRSHDTRT
jgi:hypothetical protein